MDGIDRHTLQTTEAGLMRKSWDANAIGGWQSLAIVDRGPEVADFPTMDHTVRRQEGR